MVATADGIKNIYGQGFLSCNLNRMIVAALILVVPAQSRDFHTISKYLALPSALAIIITLLIVIVTLVESLKEDDIIFAEATIVGIAPGTNVFDFLQSLSSIVFAFQGQSIFMELMTEMKNPKEFSKSCNFAYIIMGIVYTVIVIVAYGVSGDNVEDFLPDGLSPGAAKTTIGVLVVFHIVVAYAIAIQPFHCWAHSIVFPKTFNSSSVKGQIHWFFITLGYIIFAFVVANLIPFSATFKVLLVLCWAPPSFSDFHPSIIY